MLEPAAQGAGANAIPFSSVAEDEAGDWMMATAAEQHLTCEGVSVVVRVPSNWKLGRAVILAHGAGQDMNSRFMSFFHEGLADLGYLSVSSILPIWKPAGERRTIRTNCAPPIPA